MTVQSGAVPISTRWSQVVASDPVPQASRPRDASRRHHGAPMGIHVGQRSDLRPCAAARRIPRPEVIRPPPDVQPVPRARKAHRSFRVGRRFCQPGGAVLRPGRCSTRWSTIRGRKGVTKCIRRPGRIWFRLHPMPRQAERSRSWPPDPRRAPGVQGQLRLPISQSGFGVLALPSAQCREARHAPLRWRGSSKPVASATCQPDGDYVRVGGRGTALARLPLSKRFPLGSELDPQRR